MRHLILTAFLLLGASIPSRAQEECDPPTKAALSHAKSCAVAVAKWRACPLVSSSLVEEQFQDAVIRRCETTFLNKLSPAGKRRYAEEKKSCVYEYEREEGNVWGVYISECQIDVAARFAASPALADQPAPRASFDCDKAQTLLGKAICSEIALGRADIVLSRIYAKVKNKFRVNEKPLLLLDQQEWRKNLPAECRLTGVPMSPESLLCLREAFEVRFMVLEDCDYDNTGCLPSSMDLEDDFDPELSFVLYDTERFPRFHGDSAPLASFDCEKASTPLETVTCDDAKIGARDVKLAKAYHGAGKAMTEQHKGLADSQRRWRRFVSRKCIWENDPESLEKMYTHVCLRYGFETRIEQLEGCPKKRTQERLPCLNDFQIVEKKESAQTSN